MRIASTVVLTALSLVVLAHGGVLACGASDRDYSDTAGAPGVAGAAPTAGASNTAAGASGAGVGGAGAGAAGAPVVAGAGGASAGAGAGGGSAGVGGTSSAGAGGSSAGGGGMGGSGGALPFALTSTSFMAKEGCAKATPAACDKFPKDMWLSSYMQGGNHSPELNWTPGPPGTLSYALVLFDESNGFAHWAVWNIPGTKFKLPASLPNGMGAGGIDGLKQVSFFTNQDGNKEGYAGPGAGMHVYQFKLYALKVATFPAVTTGTDAQIKARTMLEASQDVLAKVDLRGATP